MIAAVPSKDIVNPENIFDPHFTTKKDVHTGEDIGTGLGMRIVKSLVLENNGTINILQAVSGFAVLITFSYVIKK